MKRQAWNKGIDHLSIEAKKRISEAMRKRLREQGHPRGMLGKHHTAETKSKQALWRPTVEQRLLQAHHKERHPLWTGDRKKIECLQCKKVFEIRPNLIQRFCCRRCVTAYRKVNKIPQGHRPKLPRPLCKLCGKSTKTRTTKNVCKECKGEFYSGKNSGSWQGGLSTINKIVRASKNMEVWRSKIFKRDDWTCQKCKARGGKLNADHHPISLSELIKRHTITGINQARKIKEIWDINNGRTLCERCHKLTETYGFRKYSNYANKQRTPPPLCGGKNSNSEI